MPSYPTFDANPLGLGRRARDSGQEPADWLADQLGSGDVGFACEDSDAPRNWPRVPIVWRANRRRRQRLGRGGQRARRRRRPRDRDPPDRRLRPQPVLRRRLPHPLLVTVLLAGLTATASGASADSTYDYRLGVSVWFRSLFTLAPDVPAMAGAPLVHRLHALLAMALFALWPFTRLVHAFTAPLGYLVRPYVVYRHRGADGPGRTARAVDPHLPRRRGHGRGAETCPRWRGRVLVAPLGEAPQ
ncbi:respiratory nitrate reductase subunit gamma [Streptomyces sp. NPDC096191]|uniref:respiratory nitrate reductase subunit gamma n=1 Tax=Streptomyces sp. NPDC096191 TaxID=3155426 RepID=UPI003332BC3F